MTRFALKKVAMNHAVRITRRTASPSCRRFPATATSSGDGGGAAATMLKERPVEAEVGLAAAATRQPGRGRGSNNAFLAYRDAKVGQEGRSRKVSSEQRCCFPLLHPFMRKEEEIIVLQLTWLDVLPLLLEPPIGRRPGILQRPRQRRQQRCQRRQRWKGGQRRGERARNGWGAAAAIAAERGRLWEEQCAHELRAGAVRRHDVPSGVMIEQSINTLIDATSRAPNGVLVFDYEPTEKEKAAMIARLPGNLSNRPIEESSYGKLDAAMDGDRASAAPAFVHEAWPCPRVPSLRTINVPRSEHIDASIREIQERGEDENLLDFATPPDAQRVRI